MIAAIKWKTKSCILQLVQANTKVVFKFWTKFYWTSQYVISFNHKELSKWSFPELWLSLPKVLWWLEVIINITNLVLFLLQYCYSNMFLYLYYFNIYGNETRGFNILYYWAASWDLVSLHSALFVVNLLVFIHDINKLLLHINYHKQLIMTYIINFLSDHLQCATFHFRTLCVKLSYKMWKLWTFIQCYWLWGNILCFRLK
jgi:hypothetical protein